MRTLAGTRSDSKGRRGSRLRKHQTESEGALEPSAAKKILLGGRRETVSDYVSSQFRDSFDFPFNPDPLAEGNQYDIYDEMRHDDGVKAAMSVKKDMTIATGWEIVCGDEATKQFFTDQLNNLHSTSRGPGIGFEDCLRDMLSHHEYGFSITEPTYRFDKDLGLWVYSSLKTRPPHGMEMHIDVKGNLLFIIQNASTGPKKLDPKSLIHLVNRPQFGNQFGDSDYRAAHPAWKAKKFINRFMAIHLERFASGTIVGKHDGDAGESQELLDTIKQMQTMASWVIPKEMEVEILEAKTMGAEHYVKAIEHYNLRIARALLVPDLIGMSGAQTSGGSLALGKEQFRLFLNLIAATRQSVARLITNKLIQPLAVVNFGKDVKCEFRFKDFSEELLLENFKTWIQAVQSGAIMPTEEDVAHLKANLGFPKDSQPLVGPGKTAPSIGNDPSFEPVAMQTPESAAFVSREGDRPRREQTSVEKKMDFPRVNRTLDSAEKSMTKRLDRIANKMISGFISDARDRNVVSRRDAGAVNKLDVKFQKEMNRELRNEFLGLFDEASDQGRKEIIPSGTKKFVDTKQLLPEEFEQVLRDESFKLVGEYATNVTKKGRSVILQAIKDGLSPSETFRLAKQAMKDESDRWVQTVARTKTTEIYNEARKSFFENDPIAKELVVGYQWSSIIDDRTSDICRCLDGKNFRIGPISDRLKPPAHFNCRSVVVPITRFEDVDFIESFPKECFTVAKGGRSALVLQSQKTDEKAFQSVGTMGLLTNAGDTSIMGDSTVVAPPGAGKHLEIRAIRAQNLNLDLPVQVGFRADLNSEIKFRKLLQGDGGEMELKFGEGELVLPEGKSLYINLTSPIDIHWEVEYQIVDTEGKRVA